jgi:hypothetical protein
MAPSTQARYYDLFLQGVSCGEMVRQFPNSFSLGAVVRARIENNWDLLREEYRLNLYKKVQDRLEQVTMESVERVANEIAVANKVANDKLLGYLRTGDESGLPETVGSAHHLRTLVGLLKQLTCKEAATIQHNHRVEVADSDAGDEIEGEVLPTLERNKPLSATAAASALAVIHRNRGGR